MPLTTASPLSPSPKRKRNPPPYILPVPHTASTLAPSGSPAPSRPDSPRTVVANQLADLRIMYAVASTELEAAEDSVALKKLKTGHAPMEGVESGSGHRPQKNDEADIIVVNPASALKSNSSSISEQAHTTTSRTEDELVKKDRTRSLKHRSRSKSPTPDLATLTWKDSEITGHLAGPSTDPDDDGRGINGIGFKPTPATAYARSQKRRQQILEWRAREAREARQKRSERRRRGISGTGTSSRAEDARETKEAREREQRAVRFAE
ncbi:hypothetical protein GQ43DRAFT_475338 [Delitschia confertaspora ATCC 74209]|uniref:Uncharacterized protein n=1 Tax=Delitschia confertaspora ATCC 74209 TaxID=1513339 RepID=A0A9P4JDP5_9PLEO|nr:hypothetical protein GQ43DRAFT_475338 [Delitschia confertaspora ATCC 74209]